MLRGLLVVAVLVVWLALGGVGGASIGSLSEVQENDAAAFLPSGAESTRAGELAADFSEDSVLPALVVVEGEGTLDEAQVGLVQQFADGLPALELSAGRTLEEILVGPPVVAPAEDGEAMLVTLSLDADAANEQIGEERAVNLVVEELRAVAQTELSAEGLEVWVTGPAGAIADLVAAFGGIDSILLLVALGVVFVILVLVYRSPSLPFAVLVTSLFGLGAAALVVYQLAKAGVLVLNGQSQGILFILVVGAATDYSLLIVARYREELRLVTSVHTAMRRALRASIEPVAASAGTVIAGLLCLLLSDLASNSSLGPVAAIGIAAAFLSAMTLLPALLLAGGQRFARLVFWPRVPRPTEDGDRSAAEAPAAAGSGETVGELEARSGVWGRVSARIAAHPRRTWATTAVVLAAAAAFVPTFQAEGTSESDIFLTEVESVTGQDALARHFDAGQVQPITVVADEQSLDAVLAAVDGVAGVERAAPVGEAPQGTSTDEPAPPRVVEGRVLVEVLTEASSDSQTATIVVEDVRDAVHPVADEALVGGAAAERLDTQLTSARDLTVIVPAVLVVILLVLIGLLRSVLAPVLLVLVNLLSFGATLGIGAIFFNHVFDMPGADAVVPLYAFVFLIALGIDYSIFLMTRVREEALTHGTRAGVRRGLSVTGGVITSAGVVLAATFGALAVLPLLFLAQLAFLVALGVLIDTLVVRTLLVPGLVHDLGRASWWPWTSRIAD